MDWMRVHGIPGMWGEWFEREWRVRDPRPYCTRPSITAPVWVVVGESEVGGQALGSM